MKFNLIGLTKVGEEDCYLYRSSGGEEIQFHSHPTRPFCAVVLKGPKAKAQRLYEQFWLQGLKQREGGFKAAIQSLTI